MKKGGIGGGNTKTGIFFEKETDLASLLNKQPGYDVRDDDEYPSKFDASFIPAEELYQKCLDISDGKTGNVLGYGYLSGSYSSDI